MNDISRKGAEAQRADEADTFPFPPHGFTCYFCGETFKTIKSAALHFGAALADKPGCVLKLSREDNGLLALVRQQAGELTQYREEDQPIMREIYAMGAKHSREVIAAEQMGYDRGLKDGRIFLTREPLPNALVSKIEADLQAGTPERATARKHNISHARVRGINKRLRASAPARPMAGR